MLHYLYDMLKHWVSFTTKPKQLEDEVNNTIYNLIILQYTINNSDYVINSILFSSKDKAINCVRNYLKYSPEVNTKLQYSTQYSEEDKENKLIKLETEGEIYLPRCKVYLLEKELDIYIPMGKNTIKSRESKYNNIIYKDKFFETSLGHYSLRCDDTNSVFNDDLSYQKFMEYYDNL